MSAFNILAQRSLTILLFSIISNLRIAYAATPTITKHHCKNDEDYKAQNDIDFYQGAKPQMMINTKFQQYSNNRHQIMQ